MKQIELNKITKCYKKYRKPYHVFMERAQLIKPVETLTVLDNVSFGVKRGESIAIVGSNGAGKTTLLKIILGITKQTSGNLLVTGDLIAMMVIGIGTHDSFSGRYNIYLMGAMFGMTKKEINSKFDDIVSFAGVEEIIDMPIRAYSRGMRVRLIFSVMMHVKTDGIIIDETLAFSDFPFRKMCVGKLKEQHKNGMTLIVASHDLDLVREISDRVLWIREGCLIEDGPASTVLDKYEHSFDYMTVKE